MGLGLLGGRALPGMGLDNDTEQGPPGRPGGTKRPAGCAPAAMWAADAFFRPSLVNPRRWVRAGLMRAAGGASLGHPQATGPVMLELVDMEEPPLRNLLRQRSPRPHPRRLRQPALPADHGAT